MPNNVTLQNGILYIMNVDGTEVCHIDMTSNDTTINAKHICENTNNIQDFNIDLPDVKEEEFIRVLNGDKYG